MQEKIFLNDYVVTSDGRVLSNKRKTQIEMKIGYVGRKRNYGFVNITINGKNKPFYVHRLVAEAFIPNPENKPQVNHIDGNPRNNNAENLEWCTNKENITHAYDTGLYSSKTCIVCGEKWFSRQHRVCVSCTTKLKLLIESEFIKIHKEIYAKNQIENVGLNNLSEEHTDLFLLRLQGKTFEEIAELKGCSKQNIHQKMQNVLLRHAEHANLLKIKGGNKL